MTMTNTPPAQNVPRRCRGGAGFTLIEILVVVGIIVILVSVLVPLVGRAMRQAKQTRTAADMGSIGTALEAFKADHGDYPRPEPGARGSGAALLGRYLFGPYGDGVERGKTTLDDQDPPEYAGGKQYLPGDAVRNGGQATSPTFAAVRPTTSAPPTGALQSGTNYDWAPLAANDGIDGPGLSMRQGGKKFGPYLQEGKFKFRGLAVLDGNDNPILYFPGRPGQGGDLTGVGAKPDNAYVYRSSLAARPTMKYDADDNLDAFRRDGEANNESALRRIRAMLGDYGNADDDQAVIETDKNEQVLTEAPYLLWAAGPDGFFGPTEITDGQADADRQRNQANVGRCDDVTSFK